MKIEWRDYTPVVPNKMGVQVFKDYPLTELIKYFDWTPFFIAWELAGKFPNILKDDVVGKEATRLYNDAELMLSKIINENWFSARAVYGLFPANTINYDDIEINNFIYRICNITDVKSNNLVCNTSSLYHYIKR